MKERNAEYFAMFREIAFYVKILLIKRTSKKGVCDDWATWSKSYPSDNLKQNKNL